MTAWTTACPDWEKRIISGQSLIPFKPLFPDQADLALQSMDDLRIVDMAGSPTFGETSRPWIRDFVSSIFGAYDADTGRRLVREWFLLISKKNTKSTTAGLLMLNVLITNWRQAGEFGILAPTIEVANNAFKPAADAIKADEELSALFHVQDHIRTITHRGTRATLQVVAADSDTVAGKKWIITLIDELWLFGKKLNASDMFREATGGLASRPEGCVIWLSTQSNEPPAGVFKEKLQYARDVRDGIIDDPQFCPVLYEFPEYMLKKGLHKEPKNFYITNPNLGYSVDEDFLLREHKKACLTSDSEVLNFMAKHLNVEVGLNLRSNRWPGAEFWEAQGLELVTLDTLLERCEVIDVGIDGGGLDDLLGYAALGRESMTGRWLAWTRAWAHPSVLERRKQDATKFHDFEKDGHLVLVKRIGDDIKEVAQLTARIEASGLLDKIGVDPHGLGGIVEALHEEDIPPEKIIGISQGWKLTGAIKTTERKLAEGVLVHGGQPMMNWCVGNAKTVPVGNAVSITKQASGSAKIDPLMAIFNAVSLLSLNPDAQSGIDSYLSNPLKFR